MALQIANKMAAAPILSHTTQQEGSHPRDLTQQSRRGATPLKLSHTATVEKRGRTSQPHQTTEREKRPHPPQQGYHG